jgi:hypothetical protein
VDRPAVLRRNGVYVIGYLVPGYYYFSELEKHHYCSHFLKFAIVILEFPRICHGIRMKTSRALLQVYTKTYISLYLRFLLNDIWAPLVTIIFFLPSLSLSSIRRDRGRAAAAPQASSAPRVCAVVGHSARILGGRSRATTDCRASHLRSSDPLPCAACMRRGGGREMRI